MTSCCPSITEWCGEVCAAYSVGHCVPLLTDTLFSSLAYAVWLWVGRVCWPCLVTADPAQSSLEKDRHILYSEWSKVCGKKRL